MLDMAKLFQGGKPEVEDGHEAVDFHRKLDSGADHDKTAPGAFPDRDAVLYLLDDFHSAHEVMEVLRKEHSVVPAPEPFDGGERVSDVFNSFAGFAFNDAPLTVQEKPASSLYRWSR